MEGRNGRKEQAEGEGRGGKSRSRMGRGFAGGWRAIAGMKVLVFAPLDFEL